MIHATVTEVKGEYGICSQCGEDGIVFPIGNNKELLCMECAFSDDKIGEVINNIREMNQEPPGDIDLKKEQSN